ncbi:MAG: hypothetical protein GWN67_02385 [Phycisphaerae bacterium]|nr:DeoR/GlpR transcriptional regulator [Phycisphaerae bacterium]NIP52042.1 DeoR/GlpR transcriptional regulator [Phycisphaerae bacterium]NIS50007.1 DeoR/GlpR transcriptional regulator [Phycisphaerae bacterium]NIU10262.1 DeoR/GlpR transcriptional regulator [Phycisphaerae bacterium]NIU55273.1 hypothetical protein [Phycisphaerae bacterium]
MARSKKKVPKKLKNARKASDTKDKKGKQKEKKKAYTRIRLTEHQEEKRGIAKYVVQNIIEDCMCIFLDAGSTVNQVGLTLFDDSTISGLTIMTNNMLVFNEFTERSAEMYERGNVLALTGGVYNQNHEALHGDTTVQALRSFNPLVVILGTSGLMLEDTGVNEGEHVERKGAFHHDVVGSEVMTKKAIASMRTKHRVIVCDYSKIGIWDASCFASIEELAKNTDRCTIVTSDVPSNSLASDKTEFNDQYRNMKTILKSMALKNVTLRRVNHDGKAI